MEAMESEIQGPPSGVRLSCSALKKDSFHNVRRRHVKGVLGRMYCKEFLHFFREPSQQLLTGKSKLAQVCI